MLRPRVLILVSARSTSRFARLRQPFLEQVQVTRRTPSSQLRSGPAVALSATNVATASKSESAKTGSRSAVRAGNAPALSVAMARICGSMRHNNGLRNVSRQISSFGIGYALYPSTRARSQGESQSSASGSVSSEVPRNSCISAQRVPDDTMTSRHPA